MPTLHRKQDFLASAEGIAIIEKLKLMVQSDKYKTTASYSPNSEMYEDNLIPFIDKHMNYLCTHPNLNHDQYLANLQLITRIR